MSTTTGGVDGAIGFEEDMVSAWRPFLRDLLVRARWMMLPGHEGEHGERLSSIPAKLSLRAQTTSAKLNKTIQKRLTRNTKRLVSTSSKRLTGMD